MESARNIAQSCRWNIADEMQGDMPALWCDQLSAARPIRLLDQIRNALTGMATRPNGKKQAAVQFLITIFHIVKLSRIGHFYKFRRLLHRISLV